MNKEIEINNRISQLVGLVMGITGLWIVAVANNWMFILGIILMVLGVVVSNGRKWRCVIRYSKENKQQLEKVVKHKKVKTREEAWHAQDIRENEPHGWIQWKGTDVCMDVKCVCGELGHVDAEFAYHVKCAACGRVYFCNGHIELIELEEEPEQCTVVTE